MFDFTFTKLDDCLTQEKAIFKLAALEGAYTGNFETSRRKFKCAAVSP
jgi:hypothetical protein